MRGIVGLDFGTTNTLCAWMDGAAPIIVPNDRGERSTPSAVARTSSGELLVGSSAKNQALADPASALLGVKRLLGKATEARLAGASLAPEDIAAAIIRKVKTDAEAYLGFDIGRAVITVPARFGDPQRRAVREAVRRAGLEAARVMNEPTAAALARAWLAAKDGDDRLVLVYDFGGGTFDATLLKAKGGRCAVLASEGDDALGGMDLDAGLYAHVAGLYAERFGIAPDDDPLLSRTLVDLCEKAKIELSTREKATVAIPFLRGSGGLVHPSVEVDRARFDAIAEPFIERSLALVARVLTEAGVQPRDVDALVVSGGSSRIPLARARLAEYLGREADPRVNPEEIVALGAAVEAARLEGRLSGLEFTDVCSRTFGLELDDGRFVPLIRKNQELPALGRRLFTTVEDFQRSVELHVMQGEGAESGDQAVSVGRFLLPGIRTARKGEPRIAVEFAIDEGDMLVVRARDLDTGAEQSVTVAEGEAEGERGAQRQRAGRLASSALLAAEGLALDAALAAELAELTAKAQADALGEEDARALCPLLEGLLAELGARRERRDRPSRAEPSIRNFPEPSAARAGTAQS